MVNKILNSNCISKKKRFQNIGNVAMYSLELSKEIQKVVKVKKIDADCIKEGLSISHKIVDTFFYLKKGGKSQIQDIWILVETKGDKIKIGIEQLSESLELFTDTKSPVYGRLVLKNVPGILSSYETNLLDSLQKKFVDKGGNLRRGNKVLNEKVALNKSKFTLI